MIPATTPYELYYKGLDLNGKPYAYGGPPVAAWDEDGEPLIVSDGVLTRASRYHQHEGVREADLPVVAAIPGGGWLAEYEFDGTTSTSPILAWLVRANGEVFPVDADRDGLVMDATEATNLKRIFHPEWDESGSTDVA